VGPVAAEGPASGAPLVRRKRGFTGMTSAAIGRAVVPPVECAEQGLPDLQADKVGHREEPVNREDARHTHEPGYQHDPASSATARVKHALDTPGGGEGCPFARDEHGWRAGATAERKRGQPARAWRARAAGRASSGGGGSGARPPRRPTPPRACVRARGGRQRAHDSSRESGAAAPHFRHLWSGASGVAGASAPAGVA
jgi:hypothetical protein